MLRMTETALNPLRHDLAHERVYSQRSGYQITDLGVVLRGLSCECRDVLIPVASGEEKIGVDDHELGACCTQRAKAVSIEGSANSMWAGSTIG